MTERSTPKKLTYGGVPVTEEYLARYGVDSDQEVYAVLVMVAGIFATALILGLVALLVWA